MHATRLLPTAALGCAVMSSTWLFIATNSPFGRAKVIWVTIGGSLCAFVTVSIFGVAQTGDEERVIGGDST
jgi:hypothetical protein